MLRVRPTHGGVCEIPMPVVVCGVCDCDLQPVFFTRPKMVVFVWEAYIIARIWSSHFVFGVVTSYLE